MNINPSGSFENTMEHDFVACDLCGSMVDFDALIDVQDMRWCPDCVTDNGPFGVGA